MARPKKQEVDYFPHYCDHGKVLFILESKWGNNGYAFFYKLLELLGKTEGHAYRCQETGAMEFLTAKTLLNEEDVCEILNKLSELKVITPELWKNKVIWMQSFVDSISHVYGRRVVEKPIQPSIPYTETPLDEGFGIHNDDRNPHSIVKYSKVKNTKKETDLFFEAFYSAYPKHIAKEAAKKAWKNIDRSNGTIDKIMAAIELQKKTIWLNTDPKYIPGPAPWLNGKRWNDEPITAKPIDRLEAFRD